MFREELCYYPAMPPLAIRRILNIFWKAGLFKVDVQKKNVDVMQKEKTIEVFITNSDFAEKGDVSNQTEALLLNAVKRAFLENNIDLPDLRFGTFNINTAHAQVGKFDKPFDDHDYQRLHNQFLKGIDFKEKRVITLFAAPKPFQYGLYSIVENEHFDESPAEEKVVEREEKVRAPKVKLSIPTSVFMVNEIMEYFLIPVI